MLERKNKGFTLIEIVIVLVIIGILVAISLPSYFSWIQRSQSAEAFVSMGSIKSSVLPCLREHVGTEQSCFNTPNACGNTIPATPPFTVCNAFINPSSPNFSYLVLSGYYITNIDSSGQALGGYDVSAMTIQAYRDLTFHDYISLSVNSRTGESYCQGWGLYQGVC